MSDSIRNLQVAINLDTSKFTPSVKNVNTQIKNLNNAFKTASNDVKGFENSFTGLNLTVQKLEKSISLHKEKLRLLNQEYEDNSEKLKISQSAYDSAKQTYEENVSALEALKKSGNATEEGISQLEKAVKDSREEFLLAEKALTKYTEKDSSLKNQISKTTSEIKKLELNLSDASKKFNDLGTKTETTDDKLKKLSSSVPLIESKMKLLSSTLTSNSSASQKLNVQQANLQTKLDLTSKKSALLNDKLKELTNKKSDLVRASKTTADSISEVEKELEEAKKEYGKNSEEVKELEQKLLSLKDAYLQLNNSIDSTESEIDTFQTELNNTQASSNKLEQELKQVSTEITKLPFTEASKKLTDFGTKIQNIGRGLKTAGTYISTCLTLPIVGFGAASLKTTNDFEAQMSKVKAISGLTGEALENVTNKSREMGKSTTFSATEAGQAMEYMALAGWKEHQMLAGIEPILRLAEAGTLDLATASDLVTDTMGGMGIAVDDLVPYLDKVAKAAGNSNTSVEQLLSAFLNVGPTSVRLKMETQEVAAVLGILANNGLKGESAGTKLNAMLSRMTAQSGPAAKAWNKIGVSVYDAQGNFRGLTTILEETKVKFDKLNDKDQSEFLKNAVGSFNSTEFTNLLNSTTGELQKLTSTVKDSQGALYDMAFEVNNNATGKVKTMKSALEELQIVLGTKLQPVFVRIVEKVTELANKFASLSEKKQDAIIKATLFVAAIGPIIAGLGSLLTIIGGVSKGLGALSSLFGKAAVSSSSTAVATAAAGKSIFASGGLISKAAGLVGGPWGIAAAAVVAGVTVAVKETKKLEKFTEESTEKTRQAVANLEGDYKKSLDAMSKSIAQFTDKDFKIVSEKDKILLQKDLKDIEAIINGGSGDAAKEMQEYIERVKKYLPDMPEAMQQETANGIKLMIETLAKDGKLGKDAEKAAQGLWEQINSVLKKPLDGLDLTNIRDSLKMQDLFKEFSGNLAEAKGWFGYEKFNGDWDQTVVSLNKMVLASEAIKKENMPEYVNNLITAMNNSQVPAELMSFAFSKSLNSALQTFGPDGASAYFKQFVTELNLGATDVQKTIENMGLCYQYLPEEQRRSCETLLADLLSHYGYMDQMTLGFNTNMLEQNAEMWSGIVGEYLAGTTNARDQVGAFVTDSLGSIKTMSDENKVKAVEWLETYLNKMIETGALTVGEAQTMADEINTALSKEITTKVDIDPSKFYAGYMKAKGDVENLDASEAEPTFKAKTEAFVKGDKEVNKLLDTTNEREAEPEIKANTTEAMRKLGQINSEISKIPTTKEVNLIINETTRKKTILSKPVEEGSKQFSLPKLDGVANFKARATELFADNLSNINVNYQTSGGYYNRTTSQPVKQKNENMEDIILKALDKMLKNSKEFTQNITINSAKELSPREIAQRTRLAGQQLLKLY